MFAIIVCFLAACDCQSDVELPLAIGKEIVGRAQFCAIGMIVCIVEKIMSTDNISILLFIQKFYL
jgi:hypothetical protein